MYNFYIQFNKPKIWQKQFDAQSVKFRRNVNIHLQDVSANNVKMF